MLTGKPSEKPARMLRLCAPSATGDNMNARTLPGHLDFESDTPDDDASDHGFWEEAMQTRAFRELIALKVRSVGPLLVASFGFVVAMSLLAGYAKPFMAAKLFGAVNVGYFLVFLTYLVCWAVSLAYVRVANGRFDAQARAACAVVSRGGRS
jgi:uncharacterized membrane protein (DUF485 family)